MGEKLPFKKKTIKNIAIFLNRFPWDVKNVKSFHSFSWTASTFALEM